MSSNKLNNNEIEVDELINSLSLDSERIPQHIAIIMDGNGRWAKQRGLDRTEGHKKGVESVRTVMQSASKFGVKYVTLYTFSTENWNRPQEEVDALMQLMIFAVQKETQELIDNNIRLKVIGNTARLPKPTYDALLKCLSDTSHCTGPTIVLAISYSSQWEITEATKQIAELVKNEEMKLENINEETISSHLTTAGIPNPDLLIRTGGEHRISNFLLWQIAYSELYFTDELWPDFNENSLKRAIYDFQQRERRYGKISEQL